MVAVTGRKVANDLGAPYFVGKVSIAGPHGTTIDLQGMVLVDSSGNTLASLPVTIAPTAFSAVSYQAQVNVTGSSGVILAANSSRKGGWIIAMDSNSQDIVITYAATATLVLPTRLSPGMVLPFESHGYLYQGIVSAISVSGTQVVEILEI
jgi:hypothetical protein